MELALLLPLVALVLMTVVQCGLLVRDQILVTHAAREAARAAAVEQDPAAAERAAAGAGPLDPDRLDLRLSGRDGPGSRVTARVTYRSSVRLPLIGQALGPLQLRGSASMRVER